MKDFAKDVQWDPESQKSHYTGRVCGIRTVNGDVLIDLDGAFPNQKMTVRVPSTSDFTTYRQAGVELPKIGSLLTVSGRYEVNGTGLEIVVDDFVSDLTDDSSASNDTAGTNTAPVAVPGVQP